MSNTFWYTREEGEKKFRDSIERDKIIRSIELEDGRFLILMNDLHQRLQEVPVHNRQGKVTGMKNVMGTFQSEIYLNTEDSERYYQLTNKE